MKQQKEDNDSNLDRDRYNGSCPPIPVKLASSKAARHFLLGDRAYLSTNRPVVSNCFISFPFFFSCQPTAKEVFLEMLVSHLSQLVGGVGTVVPWHNVRVALFPKKVCLLEGYMLFHGKGVMVVPPQRTCFHGQGTCVERNCTCIRRNCKFVPCKRKCVQSKGYMVPLKGYMCRSK